MYQWLIFVAFCTGFLGFLCIYLWYQYKFMYWEKKGVFGPKPIFPYGNLENVVKRKEHFFQPYCDSYFKYKHLPYVGLYSFSEPVLIINNLDLAKRILINDFEYFESHGIFSGTFGDPLEKHLFNVHGEAWKTLRKKISIAFSSSKLKNMYPLVHTIADEAFTYIEDSFTKHKTVNMSDVYAKFTMEVVGSVGFGVVCNGFKNPNSEFILRGHEYFVPNSKYWAIIRTLSFFAPDFVKLLQLKRVNPEITNFFNDIVKEIVDYRKINSYSRNDYLQTLVDIHQDKVNIADNMEPRESPFTMTDLAANTMLYLFAGYETSSVTGQFAAYELAANVHIQNKAREEIKQVLAKHRGQYTYEALNEMTYMNMVIDETMRKYPPMRALFRRCTKDYALPNTDIIIEKGTMVFVPVQSMQMDPSIHSNPDQFDPERFSPEKKHVMHPCHWMPFGEGPRKCLGIRQGYVQSKMVLVKLLQKYEILLDNRTSVPMKINVSSLGQAIDSGVWIRLKKLPSYETISDNELLLIQAVTE